MLMDAAVEPTTAVPWWYVAALAGGFTLLGAILAQAGSYLIAGRKNRLDDARRFDADIIETYIQFSNATDVVHNNAGGNPDEEHKIFWDLVPPVTASVQRLQLIGSRDLFRIAERFRIAFLHMAPGKAGDMIPLVDALEELREQIRKDLRIGARDGPAARTWRERRRTAFIDRYLETDDIGPLWLRPWRRRTIKRYLS